MTALASSCIRGVPGLLRLVVTSRHFGETMNWLTVPLAAAVFGLWIGVPVWLAIKHPEWGLPLPGMKTPAQSRAAGPAAHMIGLVPRRIGLGHPPAPRRQRAR